jgi:hypothetical protein
VRVRNLTADLRVPLSTPAVSYASSSRSRGARTPSAASTGFPRVTAEPRLPRSFCVFQAYPHTNLAARVPTPAGSMRASAERHLMAYTFAVRCSLIRVRWKNSVERIA